MKSLLPTLCWATLLCAQATAKATVTDTIPTMSWKEVQALPLPAAGVRLAYGPAPQQFGELRLPPGTGPFPVLVLVHGGCWLNGFDYVYITRLAQALTDSGLATWTIEYRRLGDEGGGWPGTFVDVARATDHLRELMKDHPLDLSRVVTMGHSAGGQLALWLAARAKLPKNSELHAPAPLRVHGVIGLAPITDLHGYRVGAPDSCNASVDRLLNGSDREQPLRYAQTSPLTLLPLAVPQWILQGARDPIVPVAAVRKYVEAARAKGDRIELLEQPMAGHFEPAVPTEQTLRDLNAVLAAVLRRPGELP